MAENNASTADSQTNNGTMPISPVGMIVAYTGLYSMALVCLVYGSFLSAKLVQKHREKKKYMESSITFADAKWFPITASSVLFGLYCIFKRKECLAFVLKLFLVIKEYFPINLAVKIENFLTVASSNQSTLSVNETLKNGTSVVHDFLEAFSKENVSYFLLLFFCWQGVFALAHLLKPVIVSVVKYLPKSIQKKLIGDTLLHYRISFTKSPNEEVDHENVKEEYEDQNEIRKQFFDWKFDGHDIVSLILCSGFGISHICKRSWITNNAFGLAFTLFGIEALHLSSFKAGSVLLLGLFVYDVFWVFATDVMSTVAMTVNAPILLMFPQDLLTNGLVANKFAMLGLGDIVIPGIFLALLLRFGQQNGKVFYFYATTLAYALGLMLTIFVMHYFKAAQPALLYLVPACLGAPLLLALLKGDLKALVSYDEADLVKPENPSKKTDDKKKSD